MEAAMRIRAYLEENGIKQVHVARKAGIDDAVFNNILSGKTKLTVERLELIAKALDKRPEFFLS